MDDAVKRFILIGRSTAGKTTLCQKLCNQVPYYHKTQTVKLFGENLIDTPGEYLERRWWRCNLTILAADADVLLFVQDATEEGTTFPPAYATGFMRPVVGVVTKCDLADNETLERASHYLRMAGAEKIFEISNVTGEGIEALREFMCM